MKRKRLTLLPFVAAVTLVVVIASLSTTQCGKRGDEPLTPPKAKTQIPIDEKLKTRIDSFIVAQPHVGTLALMVYDITADRPVYEYKADTLMRPASCMKLLSAIATLKYYGRSYTYRNRLYTSGTMKADTLVGDIILKTQFDPFFNQDSLRKLVEPLKTIKKLQGRVILDMADYYPMNHEEHWTMGDLRTSRLGLCYTGGARMKREIQTALAAKANLTIPRDSIQYGRLVPQKSQQVSEITTPIQQPLLKAMKNSSNINAESMLYLLGYSVSNKGNYRSNGRQALMRLVRNELHMSPKDVCNVHDGCGLCPDDRLSPRLLVALLRYAHAHPYIYKEVYEALPLSGTDGTLHDRMRQPNVCGLIKAKTGTLTREAGISTLAGYYTSPTNQHLIAFAIMNNECPVMDGRWWQDRFCQCALLPK